MTLLASAPALAERGGGGGGGSADRADRAVERAARDAARLEERSQRDTTRYEADRTEILQRNADDPARQQRDLARLEEDRAEDIADIEEQAARDAEDLAEDLARAEEDAEENAADRLEDAAEYGSSEGMQGLAADEAPEQDDRGYPVRRGEVVALNLTQPGLARMQQAGFRLLGEDDLPALDSRITRLAAPSAMDAGEALAQARRIEPEGTFDFTHYYRMQFSPSGNTRAQPGAALPRRAGRLSIGMIDTALAEDHPALRGAQIAARNFGTSGETMPTAHGTAVASILVSEGARQLHVANVFRGTGREPYTSADSLARAIEWMVAEGVPVVNMSLAGPRNAILDRLIERAISHGTVIVAAAGNGGPRAAPAYPAALAPVVAVTAVDARNRVYRYANQGPYITVAARGVDEPAAQAGGGIALFSGTSFATPHVAAWMARCLDGGEMSACARQLRASARDLGAPGHDPVYGHGLIAAQD